MPLIILGIIVVGGALFLILSQIKPRKGRRLRGGYNGFGFGGFDGLGALQNEDNANMPAEGDPANNGAGDGASGSRDDDGKVLFIFGSGEREERSLNEDDDSDS